MVLAALIALSAPLFALAALSDYTRLVKTDMAPCVPLASGPCIRVGQCGDYPPNPNGACNLSWVAEQCDATYGCVAFNYVRLQAPPLRSRPRVNERHELSLARKGILCAQYFHPAAPSHATTNANLLLQNGWLKGCGNVSCGIYLEPGAGDSFFLTSSGG
jgi:hypothetical protein